MKLQILISFSKTRKHLIVENVQVFKIAHLNFHPKRRKDAALRKYINFEAMVFRSSPDQSTLFLKDT